MAKSRLRSSWIMQQGLNCPSCMVEKGEAMAYTKYSFQDAKGQTASISLTWCNTYELIVRNPSGHESHHEIYTSYRNARRAMTDLGTSWKLVRRENWKLEEGGKYWCQRNPDAYLTVIKHKGKTVLVRGVMTTEERVSVDENGDEYFVVKDPFKGEFRYPARNVIK